MFNQNRRALPKTKNSKLADRYLNSIRENASQSASSIGTTPGTNDIDRDTAATLGKRPTAAISANSGGSMGANPGTTEPIRVGDYIKRVATASDSASSIRAPRVMPERPQSVAPTPQVISQEPHQVTPHTHATEMSIEAQHVMRVYQDGLLLVTSVKREDLVKMHTADSINKITERGKDGSIKVESGDLDQGGALRFAKVNWTLTSPRMTPHYFGMMTDEHTPMAEPNTPWGRMSNIGNPRIATLADPELMGERFMRGKDGHEDFREWVQDQSSPKTGGITNGAPLFGFNKDVKGRLIAIRKEQESRKMPNPEINTFGFSQDAVVGFLVAGDYDKSKPFLQQAKEAMGGEQSEKRIPVFTWEKTNDRESPWNLKLLDHV
jgi:hypothetical protein